MEAEGDETPYPGFVTPLGLRPRCARRPMVGACASSNVRRDGGGERRSALPGLFDSARASRASLTARAYLRRPRSYLPQTRLVETVGTCARCAREPFGLALALPPTYAGMEAERDGAPYPGCSTPLGLRPRCARRPMVGACASSNVRRDGGGGRRSALPGLSDSARARLRFLQRTPEWGRRETGRLTRAI